MKKTNKRITKEDFIEAINKIKEQFEYDDKCNDAFKIIFPDDYPPHYDTHYLLNGLVDLLKNLTNDNHKDSWIEYYIYETDFGKHFDEPYVFDKKNKTIPLTTPEDLWNLVMNK